LKVENDQSRRKSKKRTLHLVKLHGVSAYPPLPAYSISNPTRTDGMESDLLDWIAPSSDLYTQPICHRW
uniref:Uncharacterized protein n=1 Tax=Amphiprion ocellaris TaxID=80972 RepID=A0A3Q1CQH6_AMPOC